MSEMQGTLFEFDQENELHRKAQYYIETMDREKFPVFGDLMVTAIVDYFDRYYGEDQAQEVPIENKMDAMIERAVERALERKLPEILGPMLENIGQGPEVSDGSQEQQAAEDAEEADESIDLTHVEKDINWGFLGG